MKNAVSLLKDWLRSALYVSGVLGLLHRWRNRRTLTVLMFHRVLPVFSADYRFAEREFTFSSSGFARCLEFMKKHYHVISMERLRAAVETGRKLPDRAALITFDDGWRDTLEYALPELRRLEMPALLFLTTEVVELESGRWWQDRLAEVMASAPLAEALLAELGLSASGLPAAHAARIAAARIAELPERDRQELLREYAPAEVSARQMLCAEDLPRLKPLFAIGGHGHTHGPLPESRFAADELRLSRDRLTRLGACHDVMSFPHGAYTENLLELVRRAGFRFVFTSDPCLVNTETHERETAAYGRIHVPENQWTCDGDGISRARLASFLFFRPIV
ncbi:MAG: polysaccharide deacetylase family protein [Candidatus Accumulibacter sp.]|jgi:peptidoglycan/xylan/chitin deacetylase (PgdA/CDA1 family)|nr:polysaccharide deacetylase family protein [Accumulibacter sp.]